MSKIKEALMKKVPEFRAMREQRVRAQLAAAFEQFGPALRGIYNSTSATLMREAFSRVTVREGNTISSPLRLCEERLAAYCQKWAEEVATQWLGKIEAKVGDLTDVRVSRNTGLEFAVHGMRGTDTVTIEQRMIVNYSKHGMPFNQFPATIFLNGMRVSEAQYAGGAQ